MGSDWLDPKKRLVAIRWMWLCRHCTIFFMALHTRLQSKTASYCKIITSGSIPDLKRLDIAPSPPDLSTLNQFRRSFFCIFINNMSHSSPKIKATRWEKYFKPTEDLTTGTLKWEPESGGTLFSPPFASLSLSPSNSHKWRFIVKRSWADIVDCRYP